MGVQQMCRHGEVENLLAAISLEFTSAFLLMNLRRPSAVAEIIVQADARHVTGCTGEPRSALFSLVC